MDKRVSNFHLWFLANLSRLLGYRPGNDYTPGAWFDIREGLYTPVRPAHPGVMTQECAELLDTMLHCDVWRLGEVVLICGRTFSEHCWPISDITSMPSAPCSRCAYYGKCFSVNE